MKIGLRAAGLATVFALVSAIPAARAADATGTWKGSFDFQGTSVPLVFHLTVTGDAVTGTVEGLPTSPAEIHDGKVDADGVVFSVDTDYEGQTYKLVFKGKVSDAGDEIAFTFGTDDGSFTAQLTATKGGELAPEPAPAAIDVSGTWKGAFDFNGTSVPLVIHLTSANGEVTGSVEGLPTTPAEIHDGKIDGDTVTFWVNTDYQGTTYKLVYKGKVAAGQIAFTLGTEDGSWSAEMTAARGSDQ